MIEYRQIFGLIVIVLSIVLLPVIPLLHYFRHTNTVQKREYVYLQLQMMGAFLSAILLGGTLLSRGEDLCYYNQWAGFMPFILYALPTIARAWIYCFRYHVSLERRSILLQQETAMTTKKTKRMTLLRRQHYISTPYLRVYLITGFLFHLGMPIVVQIYMSVTGMPSFAPVDVLCNGAYSVIDNVRLALFLVYVLATAVTAFFVIKSKDAYGIKVELTLCGLVWSSVGLLYLLCSYLYIYRGEGGDDDAGIIFDLILPRYFVISLGLLFSMMSSGLLTCIRARREVVQNEMASELPDTLTTQLLESPLFCDRFATFLCLQFSIENLLFWLAVQNFKEINGANMRVLAKDISDNYIMKGATHQININSEAQRTILTRIANDDITSNLFSDAQDQVFYNMKFSSYASFREYEKEVVGHIPPAVTV
eukprot:TRINITY_DN6808_c0_g2_i1.p1 TRINITY_DN6808_c0_g2~~TRINITY_DN6808_c0_g2_i1.p1  ORF type:complete len:423 (-),score=25.90 TRINITY_DN6808_c0_g2_i1:15-1283(-)